MQPQPRPGVASRAPPRLFDAAVSVTMTLQYQFFLRVELGSRRLCRLRPSLPLAGELRLLSRLTSALRVTPRRCFFTTATDCKLLFLWFEPASTSCHDNCLLVTMSALNTAPKRVVYRCNATARDTLLFSPSTQSRCFLGQQPSLTQWHQLPASEMLVNTARCARW